MHVLVTLGLVLLCGEERSHRKPCMHYLHLLCSLSLFFFVSAAYVEAGGDWGDWGDWPDCDGDSALGNPDCWEGDDYHPQLGGPHAKLPSWMWFFANGKQGLDGRDGRKGDMGDKGDCGDEGEPGMRVAGPPGMKGTKGEPGEDVRKERTQEQSPMRAHRQLTCGLGYY